MTPCSEKALDSFTRQLEIAEDLGLSRHIAMANNMLGNVHKKLKNFDTARGFYDRALKIAADLSLRNLQCEFGFEKAELLFEMNRPAEAEVLAAEASSTAEAVGRKDFLFKARLLNQRIAAGRDPQEASRALLAMLPDSPAENLTAAVYFHLYTFTKEPEYREKALSAYEKLLATAPRAEYRDCLKELTR